MKYAQVKKTSGTLASTAGVGSVAWTNPGNAVSSNDVYATASLGDSQQTVWLTTLNWSFAIPDTASIRGIIVTVEKKQDEVADASVTDASIKLWNNAAVGDDKASTNSWQISDTETLYGASDDLWGYSWTPALINAATFGVAISAQCATAGENGVASIDAVSITVWYDDLDGKKTATATNVAGAGTDWSNPTNVYASDGSYATCAVNNTTSDPLRCTNFGFSIPSAALITGVTVYVERKSSSTLTLDNSVQLVYAAAAIGTDKSTGATWPTADAAATFGGTNDTWGYALTPAIVNSSTFGVQLKVSSTASRTASVDCVIMRVDYVLGNNH